MIITNLKGGLGNQMFQYALGKSLSERNKKPLKLDISFLLIEQKGHVTQRRFELPLFNITAQIATDAEIKAYKNPFTRTLQKIAPGYTGNRYIQERSFRFDPTVLALSGNRYVEGHWMTERYFEGIAPVLHQEFSFRHPVIDSARPLEERMMGSNAVCIHIRRGDYVNNPTAASVHGVTPLEYFQRAIALVRERVESPVFFVFSDDSTWSYENLRDIAPAYFIEKELEGTGATNSDYLQLMARGKHFIISNSTYSWWGAWLSQHPHKIVIAPKKWFQVPTIDTTDVCPQNWIRI
jgi:hypothetical protein